MYNKSCNQDKKTNETQLVLKNFSEYHKTF